VSVSGNLSSWFRTPKSATLCFRASHLLATVSYPRLFEPSPLQSTARFSPLTLCSPLKARCDSSNLEMVRSLIANSGLLSVFWRYSVANKSFQRTVEMLRISPFTEFNRYTYRGLHGFCHFLARGLWEGSRASPQGASAKPHRRERGDSRVTHFCSPPPQQLVPRLHQRVRLTNSFGKFAGQPFHKLRGRFVPN
jgi:hypothetical protein